MADPQALIDRGVVTYRQLDHWARRGFLHPEMDGDGSGYPRTWSADELRVAERMARLRRAGLDLEIAADLARSSEWPVTIGPGLTLMLEEVA